MAALTGPTRPFTSIPVTVRDPADVVRCVLDAATSGGRAGSDAHLLAGHSLYFVDRDPEFQEVLKSASMVVPDGKWLEILTRNQPFPLHQLRGEDLFLQVCDRGREKGLRHFFVGSTEEKLERLRQELSSQFPGILMVGSFAFPFGDLVKADADLLREAIRSSRAQIVWIGISTPRQDIEAKRIAQENKVVVVAVGAAFDFVSGDKPSAPMWMRQLGIEWLFRLLSEPGRLWRRYVLGSLAFLVRVARYARHDRKEIENLLVATQQGNVSRKSGR